MSAVPSRSRRVVSEVPDASSCEDEPSTQTGPRHPDTEEPSGIPYPSVAPHALRRLPAVAAGVPLPHADARAAECLRAEPDGAAPHRRAGPTGGPRPAAG